MRRRGEEERRREVGSGGIVGQVGGGGEDGGREPGKLCGYGGERRRDIVCKVSELSGKVLAVWSRPKSFGLPPRPE